MTSRSSDSVWMVVAEHGSDWAPWAERLRNPAGDLLVVLQQAGEPVAELAGRVRERLERVQSAGRRLDRAVIVAGIGGEGTLPGRTQVVRALTHGLQDGGGGELVLDGHDSDRFTMRAIAQAVAESMRGSGVRVRHAGSPAPLAA